MHVRIGPVPSRSVISWIANARQVLEGVRRAGDRLPVVLPADVAEAYEGYLREWDELARRGEEYLWEDDVDLVHVRHLVVYFFGLLNLDDEVWQAHGLPFAPPESDLFYEALVASITEALSADTEVGGIKASWPARRIKAQPTPEHPLRVVIIDDTEDVRILLRMTLTIDGRFEIVGEAANGQEGITTCKQAQPDAVVLDLMMPVMDGITALPGIRDACPDARILIQSANDEPTLIDRAFAAGADGFVLKTGALDDVKDALLG